MTPTSELWAAYSSTRFEATTSGGKIMILVGGHHPDLDALLERHRRRSWCFITAWNPGSRQLPESENNERNGVLRSEIELAPEWGPAFEGVGRPPNGSWHPEGSFLVFGIDRGDAIMLGRRHGQNAVVWGVLGGVAKLLDCRPGQPEERSPTS